MSNETVIEETKVCELHQYGDPDFMGFVSCSKCGDAFNIHDEIEEEKSIETTNLVPAVRVRFCPPDTDETYDGTVIEETQYSYLVIPDDNLIGTARWNKRCCDILR